MRGSKGFLLINDVIIFLLCSLLLLSAASTWKTSIMRRQQYHKLSKAMYCMEDYLAGDGIDLGTDVNLVHSDIKIGRLRELQVWEGAAHERLLCNLFIVEKKD